jgi:DNA-binding HxlR family transcriptional regulator
MRNQQVGNSCATSIAIGLLQGRWRIEIVCAMRMGPVRLRQLARRIPGASKRVLTDNLGKMEDSNLIVRTDLSGLVRQVEYDLIASVKK